MKEKYLELIENLELDSQFLDIIGEFIETYEGEYTEGLNKLLVAAITVCVDQKYLQTKADLFDELGVMKDDKDDEVEKLMNEQDTEGEMYLEDIIVPVIDSDSEDKKDETQ